MSATPKQPLADSHCGACGTPYDAPRGWPRSCASCGTVAYRNPLPVAVALLPVTGADGTGLVVITRTIEPQRGGLALPGGFVDHGESWQQAVVRELREETRIEARADEVRLADVLSSPAHLLVLGLLPARAAADLPPSAATEESAGWEPLWKPAELAFPLHTEAVRAWFAGEYAHGRGGGPAG
ncbi:NUDIX domain-containing protein [Streptomyces sp. NPDC006704]|uniref:NUDIX domain-containing protein n=1 Tax=Streptomyces sp. NPDC006704 TaxID=3364760 RepID=UPI00367F714E